MGGDHAMKTQLLVPRPSRILIGRLAFIAVALLLVAGLFLASVLLPPLAPPVHALNAPPAAASQAPNSDGVNGTLASFTALIPEIATVYLPSIVR
jgi:hypothetical protein